MEKQRFIYSPLPSHFHRHQSVDHQVVPAQVGDTNFFSGLSIAPAKLIDEVNAGITRRAVATDGFLDFYMHVPGGAVNVSGGSLGGQLIQSLPIPLPDQEFVRSVIARLDAVIDLDFRVVDNSAAADIDLFYDSSINLGGPGTTLGLATSTGRDWELFVNYPPVQNDEAYRRYVFLHEFGHALGLEHSFDASDGDVAKGITDPWSSNYPEETVMAYRSPLFGVWPDFFTANDLNALAAIWAPEQQQLSSLGEIREGSDFSEAFLGGLGDDMIRSNGGDDKLMGGWGVDALFAGDGNDWINGNQGDDDLWGQSGDDVIHGGLGNDRLNGGVGDDVLSGDGGADLFVVSKGFDLVTDFDFDSGDRVFVAPQSEFDIRNLGIDLEVVTDFGSLILQNVDASMISLPSLIQNI